MRMQNQTILNMNAHYKEQFSSVSLFSGIISEYK